MLNIKIYEFRNMNKNLIPKVLVVLIFTLQSLQLFSQIYETGSNLNNEIEKQWSEKVKMHIDRDLYVSGENLFFKLYSNYPNKLVSQKIDEFAYIVLRSGNGNIIKSVVKIVDGSTFGSLSIPDTLKSGVYQIVAFTNYMRNYGEESFFYKNILIINRFDKLLSDFYLNNTVVFGKPLKESDSENNKSNDLYLRLSLEKDSFYVREKIILKIKSDNPAFDQKSTSVSISVKEINPLIDTVNFKNIPLSLSFNRLDTLMESRDIPNQDNVFLPEIKGIYLGVKIHNKGQTVKGECLYISTPDTVANLQYSFSDKKGHFNILLNNYYVGKNVILKLKNNNSANSDYEIEVDDKFEIKSKFIPVLPKMSIELKKYIFSCQDLTQIQKSYSSVKVKTLISNELNKPSFPFVYRLPTTVVYPSRFVALENFKEIASNLLMGFKITKENNTNEAYMVNFLTKSYFNFPPAIFLDGVPLDNINQIIGLSSEDIKKIELCNILKIKGELNFPGVLSVFSNKNLINTISFLKPYKRIKIEKVLNESYLELPEYSKSSIQDTKPDFRQLLYWNPNILLDMKSENIIEFFASDYITEYLIEVCGVSDNGKSIIGYAKFKVYR